jgi:uncharacterized repeat protein (TIGR01451 family)
MRLLASLRALVFGTNPPLVTACLLLFLALTVQPSPASAQTVNQYSNTTTGTITDNNCGTAGQITRTFTVPTTYIVGDVNIGVFASHTYRSDLRITLRSPAGTTVTVMTWTGNVQSGDNLNDLFDDEAAAAIGTHNATAADPLTPVPPPYSHSFRPSNPLTAFDGQNASGTWTLVVCDAVAADTGQFRRADLYITSTSLSVVKTSSTISDGVSGANPKSVPGAVTQYCLLVTNNGNTETAASTNVQAVDIIPPTMTYVAGSLFSGTSCGTATTAEDDNAAGADESDPFGISVTGSTVTGITASLAAGGTFAIVFRATIN